MSLSFRYLHKQVKLSTWNPLNGLVEDLSNLGLASTPRPQQGEDELYQCVYIVNGGGEVLDTFKTNL